MGDRSKLFWSLAGVLTVVFPLKAVHVVLPVSMASGLTTAAHKVVNCNNILLNILQFLRSVTAKRHGIILARKQGFK